MYRNGNVYQELDALAIDIYVDYGINSFPLDEKELCRKMGILLIPYSSYDGEDLQLFGTPFAEMDGNIIAVDYMSSRRVVR